MLSSVGIATTYAEINLLVPGLKDAGVEAASRRFGYIGVGNDIPEITSGNAG